MGLFNRMEAALDQGIPVVMVGQGIGPMEDRELRTRAAEVLPRVDLICAREARVALPLLASLGVPPDRVLMTGDDAVELPYQARSNKLGNDIGVSLRISAYTDVGRAHIEQIRPILHQAAAKYGAKLVALPISSARQERDLDYIRHLLAGYPRTSVRWQRLEPPSEVINRTGRCRIMVTGTFHGAIFAIGQGIPVIGIAKSVEYYNKFAGLVDQFGSGCQVIMVDDARLPAKLAAAIAQAWDSAATLKPLLLETTTQQIAWQHAAYERIRQVVANNARETKVFSGGNSAALPV
jgi:colanic acid/amylovoran biosynthesis protein